LIIAVSQFGAIPLLWVQVGAVFAWLGIVGLIAGVVNRSAASNSELVRKIVHIGTGNIILLAWWLNIPASLGIAASVLFSAIALLSYWLPILPSINSVGRKSLGTFFYAASIGILIACFWQNQSQYAVLGILIMTWGDGLAALVGQRWGQHRYHLWEMEKSWEGSLTMLLVSFTISCLILTTDQGLWHTWSISLVVAAIATLLEAFSRWGIDNLTVPLGSAIIAFGLHQILL
jgi:phytol kinase